jgi:murein DD-endopeptidase MepM/ murein hydrolase activator NlpD
MERVMERLLISLLALQSFSCGSGAETSAPSGSQGASGCEGEPYPALSETSYVLPLAPGTTFNTGLTNCSSSFHGTGQPDQYAFDFDVPVGTPFIATRAGTVFRVVEDAPSDGGGAGNYVVVDHGDETFGLYYHSPMDGIAVSVGEQVSQGDVLGQTGRSGLAGYPHLHFIVVKGTPDYPYAGIPVSFKNVSPGHVSLESHHAYTALPF